VSLVTLARFVIIGAILLCLTACSNSQVATNTGKYKPIINTHPRYFVSVSGHIDPQIVKAVHLIWQTTAWTQNSKCQVTLNQFEGVVDNRYQEDYYPVTPNQQGNYAIKIPIDRYLPGYCDWRMRKLAFSIANLKNVLIASFSKTVLPQSYPTVKNLLYCKVKNFSYTCQFKKRIVVFNGTDYDIPFNRNYHFKLLIIKE
jgi:hypothetical protein